jgi:hypothetical protein
MAPSFHTFSRLPRSLPSSFIRPHAELSVQLEGAVWLGAEACEIPPSADCTRRAGILPG